MTALIVALALIVAALVVAGIQLRCSKVNPKLEYLGDLVRSRVIVTTKDDQAIRGVLAADYPDCIVLDAPEFLEAPAVEQLKGRAVVLRSNIGWIQVLSDDGS